MAILALIPPAAKIQQIVVDPSMFNSRTEQRRPSIAQVYADRGLARMTEQGILENVPEYATSDSAGRIRRWLERWGYTVHEQLLHGAEWSLEARERWVMVATTRGLSLDLNLVPAARPAALGEILDAHTPASAWRSTASFEAKKAKDEAAGNGFSRGRRFLTAADTSTPTLRRGYQKGGNCDPRLSHPTRPGMARLFSAAEHARIKGVPPALVAGLSEKVAHEVLGQSVIRPAFIALGAAVSGAAVHN